MRARGSRLQFGVELASDEPWMIRQLHDLDELTVGRKPTQLHAVLRKQIAICIRNLISMAVTLADFWLAIDLGGARTSSEAARVCAEPHRSAHVSNMLLGFHQRDHRIVTLWREL